MESVRRLQYVNGLNGTDRIRRTADLLFVWLPRQLDAMLVHWYRTVGEEIRVQIVQVRSTCTRVTEYSNGTRVPSTRKLFVADKLTSLLSEPFVFKCYFSKCREDCFWKKYLL